MARPVFWEKASRGLLDVFIRAGLIGVLAYFCFHVVQPFLNLMLWAIILAISLYPLQNKLVNWLGIRTGWVATLIIFFSAIVLLAPAYMLVASIASSVDTVAELIKTHSLRVPPPSETVETWPLIGPKLSSIWQRASVDTTSLLNEVLPHVRKEGLDLLKKIASLGANFLMFILALVIAGIFMAYGERGRLSSIKFVSRVAGADKGPQIAALCTTTIRAVAQGVVGLAFIQMLLVGGGFVVADVPGAGFWALMVLLVSIVQLPGLIVTLPVLGFVFFKEGFTAGTITFAVYTIAASQVDNILKPVLLGRGVGVPMPIVLIGVLGGTVSAGLIGLFVGPVVLAVGHRLFWQWVEGDSEPPSPAVQKNES